MNILTWLKIGGVLAIVGVVWFHFHGDAKVRKDLADYKAAYTSWRDYGKSMKASFDKSEKLRKDEQAKAKAAVADEVKACDLRVAEARRSSRAIRELTHEEPTFDTAGCPMRELFDGDRLRDALGARAPAR